MQEIAVATSSINDDDDITMEMCETDETEEARQTVEDCNQQVELILKTTTKMIDATLTEAGEAVAKAVCFGGYFVDYVLRSTSFNVVVVWWN